MVGLSGGGDSVALLALLLEAGHECHAITVDHRMRAASADEAAFAAELCDRLGVSHRTVAPCEPPRSQAEARDARYALLGDAADALGAPLLVAHTRDDQAETLRMRARRGGGTLGLSAIPPVATLRGETRLLRPLLRAVRADLRAWLGERDLPWLDDPSNAARRFERVRVRQAAAPFADATLLRLADAARAHRAGVMRAVAADFAANLSPALHYRPALRGTALVHAVRILAAWTGGDAHLPSQSRTAALLASGGDFTIAGAQVRTIAGAQVRRGDGLRFVRDPRRAGRARGPGPFARFRPTSDDPVHHVLRRLGTDGSRARP